MSNINRRAFLNYTVLTAASVGALSLSKSAQAVIGCGSGENDPRAAAFLRGDTLVASSVGCLLFEHYHELVIPMSAIENPPANGILLRTNRTYAHSHAVRLSAEHLLSLKNYETVVVYDSLNLEHEFTIQLPKDRG